VIKALVSIEVDLASSMALRLACQLGALVQMEIHPVYAKDSPPHEAAWGAGWASRTWQRELIEQGRAEISQLLASEQDFCPVLGDPRIVYGDKDAELRKIMQAEKADLYLEGVHFSWTPSDIWKALHRKFYQNLGTPVILVRALRKVNEVVLLCLDTEQADTLTRVFQSIWKSSSVPLTVAYPDEGTSGASEAALKEAVARGRSVLEESGCATNVLRIPKRRPSHDVADILSEYALVAMALQRTVKKECAELQWLSQIKTASLLAFH
jgi:hypothetical protein